MTPSSSKTPANDLLSLKSALWLGVSGVAGSLLLFAGDMLFYFHGERTDLIANMAECSPNRIVISGVLALVAAWLYTLASGQIYYAFQPARKWVRLAAFASFAAVMIAFGVVHGAYVAIATSAKNAAALGAPPDAMTQLAIATNDAMRLLTYLPFGIFTILFVWAVWKKETHYPRWMLFFTPVIPVLLNDLVVGNLEGRLRTIIGGGYLNLILLVFFTSSTIALWHHGRQSADTDENDRGPGTEDGS